MPLLVLLLARSLFSALLDVGVHFCQRLLQLTGGGMGWQEQLSSFNTFSN
jgi:hypothetical protein